jgi:6-phosphofructokinase 1
MADNKGAIGILTGGGDVPGLNPAIRAVALRAFREDRRVIGLRRGWAGLVDMVRDKQADNSNSFIELTEDIVNHSGRTGGTFLHTSRTNPGKVKAANVPAHLKDKYNAPSNDLTSEVLANLDWLGIDTLVPIGGDDTLSYAVHIYKQGFQTVAIPKTMDNDVAGTDYCIGFSTCVTRTIALANDLRTVAGSHERFLVLEVFGRYAGFSALLPTMAGAADRCLIPEYNFNIERVTELLSADRMKNPSRYAIVLVSEGAAFEGGEMMFEGSATDAYGHPKLGGIGDAVANALKTLSPKYNNGRAVEITSQALGYIVRSGDPDAMDYIVPMAYGNLAMDLIGRGEFGRMVCVKNGRYDHVAMDVITSYRKVVDVDQLYDTERYRPKYSNFYQKPEFIMTMDGVMRQGER